MEVLGGIWTVSDVQHESSLYLNGPKLMHSSLKTEMMLKAKPGM